MDGVVYILNKNNEIVHQFDCDWDIAIQYYYGKRDHRGRFYVSPKGKDVPFKRKKKELKDIKPSQTKK